MFDFSLFQKLTFDVICSTCFGIEIDSIKNPNDPFIKKMKDIVAPELSIGFLFGSIICYNIVYKVKSVSSSFCMYSSISKDDQKTWSMENI